MADYECWPLWEPGADLYALEPTSLPISAHLQERLWRWAEVYDATLNREDPASSGFSSEAERQEFIRDGLTLHQRLQNELGDDFKVAYFDKY